MPRRVLSITDQCTNISDLVQNQQDISRDVLSLLVRTARAADYLVGISRMFITEKGLSSEFEEYIKDRTT